jgi:HlyD family secretion protein
MATPVISRSILPPIATEQVVASRVVWRWLRRVLVLGLLIGGAVALRFTYFEPALVPVTVVRVQAGRVEELVTNNKAGTITARRQASLGPEIGGRIVQLPVQEGDRVRKGDVLIALADADLRAQLTLQERSLEAARAAATEACANADLAVRELDRARRLLADGFASQQSVDQAANQQVAAAASCSAATARVGQAVATVDVARVMLAKATLLAPFDAVVSKVSAHVGEWITPSPAGLPMPTALELIDVRSIYVKAPLDEVDAGKARAGLPARITMDAFPGRTFPAHVTRVGAYVSEAQQQNRTFDIELLFDDGALARTLLPGTSADVEVILRGRDNVPRLPTSAILQGGRVLVVREGVLVAVPVKTGLANWEFTEITDGLRPGDAVVISLDRPEVKEGARVTIVAEAAR